MSDFGLPLVFVAFLLAGCSSDSSQNTPVPESTGQSCSTAAQCFPRLDAGALHGDVQCLDRVLGGYCTHLCVTDADCCAVEGECHTGYRQVCSPFESTGQKMCFLACEDVDLQSAPDAGAGNSSDYCKANANQAFSCRSSGGGSSNRKVCVP